MTRNLHGSVEKAAPAFPAADRPAPRFGFSAMAVGPAEFGEPRMDSWSLPSRPDGRPAARVCVGPQIPGPSLSAASRVRTGGRDLILPNAFASIGCHLLDRPFARSEDRRAGNVCPWRIA